MNLEARKGHIIEQVKQMDEQSIEKIEGYLKEEAQLSESLDRSIVQAKTGHYTDHSEVRKKYEKWL